MSAGWDGTERRSPERLWRDQINARLAQGDAVMRQLEGGLAENTAATARVEAKADQVAADTSELVQTFRNLKGAFSVLEMLGKAAKPLTAIAGLLGAVALAWSNIRGGMK